jgi:F0F1-type ATP synthase alpha subunit
MAPYAACTLGEYRDRGKHALVIYDDFQARGGVPEIRRCCADPRAASLPGDVFYPHSRLPGRAQHSWAAVAHRAADHRDPGGDIRYIPTNVISITDGRYS